MSETKIAPRDETVHWWDILIVVVLGGVAGVLITVAAGAIALVIAMQHGFQPGDAQALTAKLRLNFDFNMAALVTSDLGFLIVTWWIARRRSGNALASFFPPVGLRLFALAAFSGIALSVLVNGGNLALDHFGLLHFQENDIERALQPRGIAQIVTALAVIGLFAPFAEEFFFRGLLLRWLGTGWLGVAITATVFALIHGQMFLHPGAQGVLLTAELLLSGIVLALWVRWTGSLRSSLAMHVAFNVTSVSLGLLLP